MSKLVGVVSLVVAGVLIGGCAQPRPAATDPGPATSAPPSAAASAPPSPMALSVEARDLSFTPKQLEAPAGAEIPIGLHNAGRIVHNLTIDELHVQLVVSPGQTGTADLVDVPPGTYTFYCSVSGHRQAGMEGTLTVR